MLRWYLWFSFSRPFISVPRSSFSSQILANTNTPVSSSLLRGVRCYHGLIPRATSQPSSLHIQTWLSRGFRSQRSKTKVIKLSSGSERPGLFRPVMFTAFVSVTYDFLTVFAVSFLAIVPLLTISMSLTIVDHKYVTNFMQRDIVDTSVC